MIFFGEIITQKGGSLALLLTATKKHVSCVGEVWWGLDPYGHKDNVAANCTKPPPVKKEISGDYRTNYTHDSY